MELTRRQIIMLVGIIILIFVLKFLNDAYISNAKSNKTKTLKIIDGKGQVEGIAEKFDDGLRNIEKQTGNIYQNATNFVADQVSNTTSSVTETIIKNTTQSIINQIEKLPGNNQEQIKELICK
ncbi:MAG: hypothetical protein AABX29_09225 [Nanoarchaeota archaeon]